MIFSHHSLSRDLVQDGDTYLMTKKSKGVGLKPFSSTKNNMNMNNINLF